MSKIIRTKTKATGGITPKEKELMDAFSKSEMNERSRYHATFGDLIDALRTADESISVGAIKGIGSYRGYYSDIALYTSQLGIDAYKNGDYDNLDYDKDLIHIQFTKSPKELATVLEGLLGKFFMGYKGGLYEITREKPLWLAEDYGDTSNKAIMKVEENLNLLIKEVD